MTSERAVQESLTRVTNSAAFQNSERLKQFLRYVVAEALAGRADSILGKTIAADVFDRDPEENDSDNVVGLKHAAFAENSMSTTAVRGGRIRSGSTSTPAGTRRASRRLNLAKPHCRRTSRMRSSSAIGQSGQRPWSWPVLPAISSIRR